MDGKVVKVCTFTTVLIFTYLYSFSNTVISLPYKKVGNLLIVQAEVEGQKGDFILDTGVSGLCLNARHFESQTGMPFEASNTGMNGQQQTIFFYQTRLKIAGLKQAHNAQVMDLSHLEKRKGFSILGLIGRSVFRNHELLLDLVNESILLIPIDKKGNRLSRVFTFPMLEIPFSQKAHFPVLSAQIAGYDLLLGLDTGAEFNVIDREYHSHLMEFVSLKNGATLVNGGQSRKVRSGRLRGLQVAGLECWPMMTLFTNMNALNNSLRGKDIDGLLGVEFLVQFRISINFKKGALYIWDRYSQDTDQVADKSRNKN